MLKTLLKRYRALLDLAHASYSDNDMELIERTALNVEDLISSQWDMDDLVPAHFIAIDHNTQSIVVSVRGTWGKVQCTPS